MAKKPEDEIIASIRRRRDEHAESFGYDVRRIGQAFQRLERESKKPVVTREARRPRTKRRPA